MMQTIIARPPRSGHRYTLEQAVRDVYAACERDGHANERVSPDWDARCYWDGDADTLGAVCLVRGIMNIGALVEPDEDPERDGWADPAGEGWAGQPAKNGKHWLDGSSDYPYGGLGCAHFDRSRWSDLAKIFGDPGFDRSRSFDQLRQAGGRDWARYLSWADEILVDSGIEAHVELVRLWLRHYWYESDEAHDGIQLTDFLNARIRNSASGIATSAEGLSVDEQVEQYFAYKLRRSERAAERAMEQVRYSKRAWVLVQKGARFMPFD